MFSYTENIIKCATDGLQKPEDFGYWGSDDMFKTWGFCGIDKHRDSKILEISNFNCISEDLMERFPEDFRVEGYKHWAVGHVDRLCVRILKDENEEINLENITEAFIAAMFWQDEIRDYPVANEDDYLDMLFQDSVDFIKDLPSDMLRMIDTSDERWAEQIYNQLTSEMSIEFDPDYQRYPNDFEIIQAVYNCKLWSKEAIEQWNEWTDNNNVSSIEVLSESPNQLKLF